MRATLVLQKVIPVVLLALISIRAPAAPPTPSAMEPMQTEYEAAGRAMHEVLERRAAGDEVGAEQAELARQLHRSRYLALRRLSQSEAESGERSPFTPDAPLLVDAKGVRRVESLQRPRWDLYGSAPASSDPIGWDLYASSPLTQEAGRAPASTLPKVVRFFPRAPFEHQGPAESGVADIATASTREHP